MKIKKLSSEVIKGILFEIYSRTNNRQAYNNINIRSLRYKAKLNTAISEEGYTISEQMIVLNEKYMHRINKDELNCNFENEE